MDKRAMADFAATLTTLAETNTAIASTIYLAMGSDINRYNVVKRMLLATKTAEVTSEMLTITDKGRKIAAQIEAVLAAS